MSAIIPFLVAFALVLPTLGCAGYLLRYIHRHRQPEEARLRVLRGLLWFIAILLVVYLGAELILLGIHQHSSFEPFLPIISLAPVVAVILLEIQKCQKRLKKP